MKTFTRIHIMLMLLCLLTGIVVGDWLSGILPGEEKKAFISREPGELHGYQVNAEGVKDLKSVGPCDIADTTWKQLPLVVAPGEYCIEGQRFNLRHGGARFYRLYKMNRYFVINDGNQSNLLSALAWATIHGTADEVLTMDEMTERAKTSKLSLRCSYASEWVQETLGTLGIESRQIFMNTVEGKLEHFNQSHVLLEIKQPDGRWWLVDVDNNRAFFDGKGNPASAWHVVQDWKDGRFDGKVHVIARDPRYDASGSKGQQTGYDYTFFTARNLGSEKQLMQWYQRTFQLPFVGAKESGRMVWYFTWNSPDEKKRTSLLTFPMVGMEKEAFMNRFYPAGK